MARRIDAIAIMKSILERGEDPTVESVQHFLGVLDQVAPESDVKPSPQAPVGQPSPSAAGGAGLELRVVEVEDKGKYVRVKVDGLPGKKYPMFVSAWEADANTIRPLTAGARIKADVEEKPNPNGKAPFVNLRNVTVTALGPIPGGTAQRAVGIPQANDIPF